MRSGGVGLGLWGGVGTLVLVFGFGLDPGEPPGSAILIIIAVVTAAAAMQAAGGTDYMVLIASRALRAQPRALNFVAPFVSYLLCILTGTSNTFYSIVPVINEVAYANKIRPERPLASSTVASALGITSSPVAAAMATMLPLVEVYDYELVDVLLITIPASIIGILAMSFVMSRHGKDLDHDEEYQRRLAAGVVQPPPRAATSSSCPTRSAASPSSSAPCSPSASSASSRACGRPSPAEGGGTEPLSVTPIIVMVMLGGRRADPPLRQGRARSEVPDTPIFKSGMVAMIALLGIAWMADTFIAANEDAIVEALGELASEWPVHDRDRHLRGGGAHDQPVGGDPDDGAARPRARDRRRAT